MQHFGYRLVNIEGKWSVDILYDLDRLQGAMPIQTIIDVGANIGQFCYKIKHHYPQSIVHSFEPVADAYQQLLNTTNSFTGVHCKQLALGNQTGKATIHLFGQNTPVASILSHSPFSVDFAQQPDHTQVVDVQRLDEYCVNESVNGIDLLKIDTEGFDLEVLQGATKLLEEKAIRFIYCEWSYLGTGGPGDLNLIREFLEAYGFSLLGLYTDFFRPDMNFHVCRNALFLQKELYLKSFPQPASSA